jgi:hypothetical protein
LGMQSHKLTTVAREREGKTSFGATMRGCARTLHFSVAPSTKGWIKGCI